MNINFCNEFKLMSLTCKKELSKESIEKIEQTVLKEIDWEKFYKIVLKHRVYPIVYKNLSTINNSRIDKNVLLKLEKKCKINLVNSIKISSELIKIATKADENGIRLLSLKGPCLGKEIYNELSLRTCRDIDLLIAESDLEKIEMILLDLGYESSEKEENLSEKQKVAVLKDRHHISFVNKSTKVIAEIHWRYNIGFKSSYFEKLWEERREYSFSGNKINILNYNENLVYLMVHGSKHAWTRLRWLCDIHDLILAAEVDWEAVIKRAKELNKFHLVVQTIMLCNLIFEFEIPEIISNEIKNDKSYYEKITNMALEFIIREEEYELDFGQNFYLNFKKYSSTIRKGILEKMEYLLLHLRPSINEYKMVKIDDKFYFLYYFVRGGYIVKQLVKSLIKYRV